MSDPGQPAAPNIVIGGDATIYGAVAGINTGTINTIIQVAQDVTSLYQLRAPLSDFVGRTREIEALLAALRAHADGSAALAAIYGADGLGKTELALRVAHALRDDYPDAQLFVNLRGPRLGASRGAADGLRDVIHAFDPSSPLPDDTDALAALYRAHLSGKRALVLLDDASDVATVRPFLPPAGCALLVTSHVRLSLGGQMMALDLATLPREESRALLLRLAPHHAGDPALDGLLVSCGDLPLAVRVVGATLGNGDNAALAPADYQERLADMSRRLKALKNEDVDVYAILGVGDDVLQAAVPALAARWRMLGVCTEPFEAATAASIWAEQDQDALEGALGQLTRRSLLNYDMATGRYRIHTLLHDLARTRCAASDAATAHLRHAMHYLGLLRESYRLYQAGHEHLLKGLALFGASRPHIIAAQAWAAATPAPEAARLCVDYGCAATSLLYLRLRPQERIEWFDAALAAARSIGSAREELNVLVYLGDTYIYLGDPGRADQYYGQSLIIARELDDRQGESLALGGLGLAAFARGDERRAVSYYEQWLAITRELGDRRREGQALVNLGGVHQSLGDVRSAIKCYAQSLVILRELGDRRSEGIVMNNLGDVYVSLGDARRANESYEQSLAIMRELGDLYLEAAVCWSIGELLAGQGEYARAGELMRFLVDYEEEIDHADAEQHAAILDQVQIRALAGKRGEP
jgi:tetratricopeptide (TPR) repeat protein